MAGNSNATRAILHVNILQKFDNRSPHPLYAVETCYLLPIIMSYIPWLLHDSSKPLSLYKKNVFVQVLQWNRKRLVSSYLGPGQPNPILNHFFNFNSNSKHPSTP